MYQGRFDEQEYIQSPAWKKNGDPSEKHNLHLEAGAHT